MEENGENVRYRRREPRKVLEIVSGKLRSIIDSIHNGDRTFVVKHMDYKIHSLASRN